MLTCITLLYRLNGSPVGLLCLVLALSDLVVSLLVMESLPPGMTQAYEWENTYIMEPKADER